jgi:tRNA(Ile)-lysidine synthase
MLQQFITKLRELDLCRPDDRILLAVSGGIDSVVMAHLFMEAGYDCAIAHCNFQLRGEHSELDEAKVRALADKLEIPVYVKHFEVGVEMQKRGISVQMAARDLRYSWFEELLSEHSMDYVATAHNKNDSVETFFLNLARGSGIRGLKGISPSRGKIIRPLLFASRTQIESYQQSHGIEFREDASNLETKYQRNKIRHDVLPVMEQINPDFMEIMQGNMNRLGEVYEIYMRSVQQVRLDLFEEEEEGKIRIDVEKLKELTPLRTWLYELFSPFGFTSSQCEAIGKIIYSGPGRQSISTSHRLFKDRNQMFLVPSGRASFKRYYLDGPEKHSFLPFPMDMEVLERSELKSIPEDPLTACLDLDTIQFPLIIRRWMHGDYFYPLGMDQIKKLSDFFVDQKVPVPEKERTWIMASGRKIVWIMGHRIDNRFRITPSTLRVLILRFQPDITPQALEK